MNTRQTVRCSKCILPKSSDLIPFAEDGTCLLCKKAEKISASSQKKEYNQSDIVEQIEYIRKYGRGKPYDCVVGVSGGRDSTYLLYLLTQYHQLRCLAVYYRTPFTPDTIDENIRKIVKKLGADFEEIQLSREYHKRIAREMVLLWSKKKHHILINLACAPCKLMNREIYKIAYKYDVPTIIYGTNIYEAVQIAASVPKNQVFINSGNKIFTNTYRIRNMLSLIKDGAKILIKIPTLWKYLFLGIKSSVFYISPNTLYLTLRYPQINIFNYFYDSHWNEIDLEETLKSLGWEKPPGSHSSWKADCYFAELKNILFQRTIGITYGEAFYSNMIRAGIITREDALNKYDKECKLSESRLKEALKTLDLDAEIIFKQ